MNADSRCAFDVQASICMINHMQGVHNGGNRLKVIEGAIINSTFKKARPPSPATVLYDVLHTRLCLQKNFELQVIHNLMNNPVMNWCVDIMMWRLKHVEREASSSVR